MPDTSDTNATLATRVWHKWDTSDPSATQVLHERHEYDTNATRTTRVRHERKILILMMTQVKTYFHIPIFTTWQVKDYKERNNFILRTNFGNALFPRQNAFEKCTTKTELLLAKATWKSYTLDCSCKCPSRSGIVIYSNAFSFSIKTILCE